MNLQPASNANFRSRDGSKGMVESKIERRVSAFEVVVGVSLRSENFGRFCLSVLVSEVNSCDALAHQSCNNHILPPLWQNHAMMLSLKFSDKAL